MSPDESPVILGEVELAREAQVIQSLAECLNGESSQRLQGLVQNGRIFTFQQTKEPNL